MIAFRQEIHRNQHGRDVKAVKRAMVRMNVKHSKMMKLNDKAGPSFIECLKIVQKSKNLKADGVYGRKTHAVIAPHFDAYGKWLYKTAKKRQTKPAPVTNLSASAAAKKLLQYKSAGKYRADNWGDLHDLEATAAGHAVWSQMGRWVYVDKRPLEALVYLIEKGFIIGTFAICSDHRYDGPHGHAGGLAVDISSINGVQVGSYHAKELTLKVAKILRNDMPAGLHPWQEICDGYGYVHDSEIAACTIPSASFYGYVTMSQHRNHIHLGYYK